MAWFFVFLVAAVLAFYFFKNSKKPDISVVPEVFVVFDLETTGLSPEKNEIIEIGAIKVFRDSDNHKTFQSLVKPNSKVPSKITQITGITQEMIEKDGASLEEILPQFLEFIGDHHLVAYNIDFDLPFIKNALIKANIKKELNNPMSCALNMARRAWPKRKSYKLVDIARDGGLSNEGTHRAIGDCRRAMIVYTSAASILRSAY